MIETCIVMAKCFPIVLLAGFAMFPVSNAEDLLLRTAAGVGAMGVIWKVAVRPAYRSGRDNFRRLSAYVERFFEEHHHAVEAVKQIEADLTEVKADVRALKEGR